MWSDGFAIRGVGRVAARVIGTHRIAQIILRIRPLDRLVS